MKDFLGMKDEGLITFVSEVSESELFCPASFILNPSSDKLFSLLSFIFQRSGLLARSAVLTYTSLVSTAARTSCTRRMFAPRSNASMFAAVVAFNASSGVIPNGL